MSNTDDAKQLVHDFWDRAACNTDVARSPKFTREYYEEIERYRYDAEPDVFSFAQFTLAHGKKVLEVGVGAATDFLQWVRAGAEAYGVDLTQEAVDHARRRLDIYGLNAAEIRQADAENLPYATNSFDLVYSWGVIHHTPDTGKALSEIVRVCRPGGVCKVMVYNRHSIAAAKTWILYGLAKGRPFMGLKACLAGHVESPGTKAFTRREARQMLAGLPVKLLMLQPVLTVYDAFDCLGWRGNAALHQLLGPRCGWFMLIKLQKEEVVT